MIECELTDYQPGTGTRYLLIHGAMPEKEARKLGCHEGALFIGYQGHGAHTFTSGATPGYVAEKLKIERYMLDAIAIAQFIRVKLGQPLIEDNERCEEYSEMRWVVCKRCKLPVMITLGHKECYCPKEG